MTVVVTLMLIKYEKRYDYSMVKNVYEIASKLQLKAATGLFWLGIVAQSAAKLQIRMIGQPN